MTHIVSLYHPIVRKTIHIHLHNYMYIYIYIHISFRLCITIGVINHPLLVSHPHHLHLRSRAARLPLVPLGAGATVDLPPPPTEVGEGGAETVSEHGDVPGTRGYLNVEP